MVLVFQGDQELLQLTRGRGRGPSKLNEAGILEQCAKGVAVAGIRLQFSYQAGVPEEETEQWNRAEPWGDGMKRRKWDAQTKTRIVLAGLEGESVTDLCRRYEIRPSQYYKWRDHFLSNCMRAFDGPQRCRGQGNLEAENTRLKKLVGELTLELAGK